MSGGDQCIFSAWSWAPKAGALGQPRGMGREGGGGFRMGDTCVPMADSCRCMAKPPQYYKVIILQLK